jgi:4-hydroxy-tetrahydrodipicolinate reductase
MGHEIVRCVLNDAETHLLGCTEVPQHPAVGQDIGLQVGVGACGVVVRPSLDDIPLDDCVIIDFTSPKATLALLDRIANTPARLVIGTTGLTEADLVRIRAAAQGRAILQSPNMSLGVNLLFYLTDIAAKKLGGGFDIEIVEAHHRFKKDAPSGTAKKLGEVAAAALGLTYDEAVVDGRAGIVGERTSKEIGMHAVRGGDIVGDHTVLFAGMGERVELRHMAHSRATFAQGAVAAAKWVASAKPGLYSMRDVLGV